MSEIEKISKQDGGESQHRSTAGPFKSEYKYLEYLNHVVTECIVSKPVKNGCPLKRCKQKQ